MRDETTAKQNRTDGLNSSAPWRVVAIQVLPDYTIAVRFADGTKGEVDLSQLVLGANAGVFAALRDRATFARAAVENGVVTWPGDLDLAPDSMYDAIRAHGRWIMSS